MYFYTKSDDYIKLVSDTINEKADALNELGQYLWDNPELAFKEKKAHDFITKYLEPEGFSVAGNYLLDTAYRPSTEFGNGRPVVIIMREYDALPEIGNACGHNLIAECAVATGIALKKALKSDCSLSGKVVVLGTPGEEEGEGKVYLLRDGAFDGADVALMAHPFTKNISDPATGALGQSGNRSCLRQRCRETPGDSPPFGLHPSGGARGSRQHPMLSVASFE
ncbi:peptidase M20 domain-containing protein 2-like [Ixodes scapularis]|uniref:peptidase M20 domain-containing protein 2-like n=1 Tax=Ixodes scapularis TaxID=6945 RepID=UPI001A9F8B06|nr:peptidase M20 domain-containing protein 2-like [Ixodes scapularis]